MMTSIRVLKSVVKKKYRKEWLWLEIRRLDVGKRIGVLEWPGGNELCRPRVLPRLRVVEEKDRRKNDTIPDAGWEATS
jgi:hypothetical protein